MKWNIAATIAFLSLISVLPVRAETVQCDSCSEWQVQSMANDNMYSMQTQGPLYIVDLVQGRVRRFSYRDNMTPDYNPEFDAFHSWYEEDEVPAQVVQHVEQGAAIVAQLASWVVVNPERPDLPIDAHEALTRTDLERNLHAYISQMSVDQLTHDFYAWLGQTTIWGYRPFTLNKPVTVLYQDGSRAIYKFDYDSKRWVRDPKSSRDSMGNLIPEKKEDAVATTYYFADPDNRPHVDDDFKDLYSRLLLLGYNLVNGNRTGTVTVILITCNADNVCTITYQQ